jgi:hypothetical protein
VTANKTLPTEPHTAPSPSPEHPADAPANKLLSQPQQLHHQGVDFASGVASRTASPARFDKFGRRIISPPLTRTNSNHGSPGTSTPVRSQSEVSLPSLQMLSHKTFTEFSINNSSTLTSHKPRH